MTLKQLEAFYRAAICDSFAIAAERLHVSVSTLSKRITDLEASLGQTLFDRDQYRASLTTAGHALLPYVRQLLDQADALRLVVREGAGVQGNFRFAVGELASLTWRTGFRHHLGDVIAPAHHFFCRGGGGFRLVRFSGAVCFLPHRG